MSHPHNPRRGEIAVTLSGKSYRLCLTLGALAELEAAYKAESLYALSQKFTSGKLSAQDIILILNAGLRGGGAKETSEHLTHEEGAIGLIKICISLLQVTFNSGQGEPAQRPKKPQQPQIRHL